MNKKWFVAALIRSVRTFAQVMAGGITIGVALSEINWAYLASTALVSAIYSILTSLAGLPEIELEKKVQEAEENVRIVYLPAEDKPSGERSIVFLNTEDEDEDGESE